MGLTRPPALSIVIPDARRVVGEYVSLSCEGRLLKAIRRGGWFLPLNLALLMTAELLIGAGLTMTFHVTFVLGAVFWVAVTSGGLLLSVCRGRTSPEDLIDTPLLTSMLFLISLTSHRRTRAQVTELLAAEQILDL